MRNTLMLLFLIIVSIHGIYALQETKNDLPLPETWYNYDTLDEDYSLNWKTSFNPLTNDDFISFLRHYDFGAVPWLNTPQLCKIEDINFLIDTFDLSFKGNFNPSVFPLIDEISLVNSTIIDKSYFMKTFALLEVEDLDNPGEIKYFLPNEVEGNYTYNINDYNVVNVDSTTSSQLNSYFGSFWSIIGISLGIEEQVPYVLTKSTIDHYNFSNAKVELNKLCTEEGIFCSYMIKASAIPIDGKCDFDSASVGLDSNDFLQGEKEGEVVPEKLTISYKTSFGHIQINQSNVFTDITDFGSSFFEQSNPVIPEYRTFERPFITDSRISLRILSKPGYIINASSCDDFKFFERRNIQRCTFSFNSTTKNQIIHFIPRDADADLVPDYLDKCVGVVGTPELMGCSTINQLETLGLIKYNQIGTCEGGGIASFNPNIEKFICSPVSFQAGFFQDVNLINNGNYKSEIYSNINPFGIPFDISSLFYLYAISEKKYSGDYLCVDSSYNYKGHCRLSAKIKYPRNSFFNEYRNLEIRKRNITTYLAPFNSPIKFRDSLISSLNDGKIYFDNQNGSLEELSINTFISNIQVEKQGEISTKKVDQNSIAIALNDLYLFDSKEEAEKKIDKVTASMEGIKINKYINSQIIRDSVTFNRTLNKSRITLIISNISDSKNRLSMYYIIPKESATTYSNISIISQPSGAQPFVTDKDPIIGWYFDDPGDEEIIIIEVPGDYEGGEIIISEEPVVYNSGNLIVRYRETTCGLDEQLLFELDHFTNTSVFFPGANKDFKVCLSHVTEDLNILGTNNEFLFNSLVSQNVSISQSGIPINVSTNLGGYWSVKIQKENPGNHSCIGSFHNLINSNFGDCDYNKNFRLWVSLDIDSTPPTVDVLYPALANTILAQLSIYDSQSGVDWSSVSYCVDSDDSCTPSISYGTPGTDIFISCPGSFGCVKYVRVSATDNEGNSIIYSKQLRLLDIGSSCQQDCTAKPSPNRYLAECSGLNGCFYYQYDINGLFDSGAYVAQQCDFSTTGAWVNYNNSHEIQCPNGPFRKAPKLETIDIESNTCGLLRTTNYPITVSGETIIMTVISCVI